MDLNLAPCSGRIKAWGGAFSGARCWGRRVGLCRHARDLPRRHGLHRRMARSQCEFRSLWGEYQGRVSLSSFYENKGTTCLKILARRWFGLFLLPLISYAADATVTIVYYIGHILSHIVSHRPDPPTTLARGEASIQFVLFWMPFFVLLACHGVPVNPLLFSLVCWETDVQYSLRRSNFCRKIVSSPIGTGTSWHR